jgi:hypothetical protein
MLARAPLIRELVAGSFSATPELRGRWVEGPATSAFRESAPAEAKWSPLYLIPYPDGALRTFYRLAGIVPIKIGLQAHECRRARVSVQKLPTLMLGTETRI